MKASRFTDSQIMAILKQNEGGISAAEREAMGSSGKSCFDEKF